MEVSCNSGDRMNDRPVGFRLLNRSYKVEEILDRWYGEWSAYFKVRADDQNIYLLKYDGNQDRWDLVFYQNPQKQEKVQLCMYWHQRSSNLPSFLSKN